MLTRLPLPAAITAREGHDLVLRRAARADLSDLVDLLADDPVSASRGDRANPQDLALYSDALDEILTNDSNDLVVIANGTGKFLGSFQLTRIPGLSRRGTTRLIIESVHVSSESQSQRIGSAAMQWVLTVAAPALGAGLVQLTSDASRTSAHRFYERLGFVGSHLGFKYQVEASASAE